MTLKQLKRVIHEVNMPSMSKAELFVLAKHLGDRIEEQWCQDIFTAVKLGFEADPADYLCKPGLVDNKASIVEVLLVPHDISLINRNHKEATVTASGVVQFDSKSRIVTDLNTRLKKSFSEFVERYPAFMLEWVKIHSIKLDFNKPRLSIFFYLFQEESAGYF